MPKVKVGFKNPSREEIADKIDTVKTAMTGNPNFTTPNPSLAAYGTLITTARNVRSHLVLLENPSGVTCL